MPSITSLQPNSVPAGSPAFTLTIGGQGLFQCAEGACLTINWTAPGGGSTALSPTSISQDGTQVSANVPANLLVSPGQVGISVTASRGTTNFLPFFIVAPVIANISPMSATAGGPAVTLTIAGSGFSPPCAAACTFVQWQQSGNPITLTPTSVSAAQVIVNIPASLLTAPGSASVAVLAGGVLSNSASFIISPAPPQITTSMLPTASVGVPYSMPLIAAGGTLPYSWSVTAGTLPPGLGLNALTGVISGTPSSTGVFSFIVKLTDAKSQTALAPFNLTVISLFKITTSSLPNGNVGTSYTSSLSTTGGTPTVVFSLTGPNPVPPGLTLSPAGTLSGIPTLAGTFTFTVSAVDATNNQATASYTVTIAAPFVFTTLLLPDGVAGSAYSQTIGISGGTPPYVFSVVGSLPPGITLDQFGTLTGTPSTIGTFPVTIQVSDGQKQLISKTFQLTVNGAAPLLRVLPLQVAFAAFVGGDSPPSQSVTVTATGSAPVSYAVQLDGGAAGVAAPSWLTVTPLNGRTPARLTVKVQTGTLGAGTYTGRIRIGVPNDNTAAPVTVPVTFTLSASGPQLSIGPSLLRFSGRVLFAETQEQDIVIRNAGGGGAVPVTAALLGGSAWITDVTPTAGQVQPDAPLVVRVHVNTSGLAAGAYRDVIRVTALGSSTDIPVALFVSGPGPILDLSIQGIRFQARQGNGFSGVRRVKVINRGDPAVTINWTADLLSGSDWLTLPSSSGTATSTNPGILILTPSANLASLPVGPRYAVVRVSAPNVPNSPQYLEAVLDLAPSTDPPRPDSESGGLVITTAPGAPPVPSVIRVEISSANPVAFQAGASTTNGTNWLSVSPTSGLLSTTAPGDLAVTVNPALLTAGIFNGEVDVAVGDQVRSFNVTAIASGATLPPSAAGSQARQQSPGACVPARLVLSPTGTINNFSVPAAWPTALIVQVNDDCGGAVRNASVVANFSNADPALTLLPDNDSATYSATWVPGRVTQQMNVTAQATAGALQSATTQLIGSVNPNVAPVLAKSGTLHNLNPQVGGALSPGLIAQVYGTGLSSVTSTTDTVPLPIAYKGSSFLVGGFDAPLYYVSSGQLVVQIPVELTPNYPRSVIATANGVPTVPDTIFVAAAEPGVAAFPDGALIVQHSDFTLVDSDDPAKRGEVLIMYLAGLGATDPSVKSGYPSPSAEPFARPLIAPTVTVGRETADIGFAGMTPFGVGLYQINFKVPADATLGTVDVVVTQGSVTANTTRLTITP